MQRLLESFVDQAQMHTMQHRFKPGSAAMTTFPENKKKREKSVNSQQIKIQERKIEK